MSMKSSHQELSSDIIIDRGSPFFIFFKGTLCPSVTFIPKTAMGLPKSGVDLKQLWDYLKQRFAFTVR